MALGGEKITWNHTGSLANHVLPPMFTVNLSSFPGGKVTAKSFPAGAAATNAASGQNIGLCLKWKLLTHRGSDHCACTDDLDDRPFFHSQSVSQTGSDMEGEFD